MARRGATTYGILFEAVLTLSGKSDNTRPSQIFKRVVDMPKSKTKRAAAKRFKVSGNGELRRAQAFKRHLLSSKNRKRKRNLRGTTGVDATNVHEVRLIMPYAK